MKQLIILTFLTSFLACSGRKSNKIVNDSLASLNNDSVVTKLNLRDSISIREDSGQDLIKQTLEALSDGNVFSVIHDKLSSDLSEKYKNYFSSKPDYNLLQVSSGDIFHNNKEDKAFIVYDKKNVRILILVYNDFRNSYFELYKDIKVENELEKLDCYSGSRETLDSQIEYDMLSQRDYLIKNPISYIEYPKFKIVDIHNDKDLILEKGCLQKNTVEYDNLNSLCVSTSSAYNNWDCLMYDKAKNLFVVIYNQGFAD